MIVVNGNVRHPDADDFEIECAMLVIYRDCKRIAAYRHWDYVFYTEDTEEMDKDGEWVKVA